MMTHLNPTTPVRARILHVGGTLQKVEEQYKHLSEAWLECANKKLEQQLSLTVI